MNIDVVLEGKLKEPCFKLGVDEFKKRLTGYVSINIVETPSMDEYLQNIKQNDYVITMEIEGKSLSSVEFSNKIKKIETDGFYNRIVFLIGGSDGLSEASKAKSDFAFSMSDLTFLHQEAAMILVEQIYRAMKILRNEPYHK